MSQGLNSVEDESKVVVQVLPSVNFGIISAVAEGNVFSGISVKSVSYKSTSQHFEEDNVSECEPKTIKGTVPISPGNGLKLLDIKYIAPHLKESSIQVIRILHYLLFGTYGLISDETLLEQTKQNILQFSGFSFSEDSDMYLKKKNALIHLPYPLLVYIHKILMNSSPVSRSNAVDSLLHFLQYPTDLSHNISKEELQKDLSESEIRKLKNDALEAHPVVLLERLNEKFVEQMYPKLLQQEKDAAARLQHQKRNKQNRIKHTKTSALIGSKKVDQCLEETDHASSPQSDKPRVKLRDFDVICSKVECATPDSLSELNDLLFIKPSDNSEIHQKILDFTSFSFSPNSFEFHSRKTLMHYMDMKTLRKIADLLDIENWENCISHQDLSQNILNFLMNIKPSDKKRKSGSKRLDCHPNIMRIYSCPKSRSCSPENFDSTYASEEMNECPSSPDAHQNGFFLKLGNNLNDSTTLFEILQHPTDVELYCNIKKILTAAPLSVTLGDLVKEVLKCYPNFNLQYRIDFIRNKALEILQEMKESTVISPD